MKKFGVILAAGKGSRMKSRDTNLSKVSFPILGKPLVKYVVDALKPLGLEKIVTIVGFGGENARKIVENDTEVVWQHEQKGAGHAVMQAAPILEKEEGCTIICCGDTPLLTTKTLNEMFEYHVSKGNALTVLTSVVDSPFGYGRMVKENGRLLKIVEQRDANPEEALIKEVNAGVYIFDNKELFKDLKRLTPNNAAGEYYITDVIAMFVEDGLKADTYCIADTDETRGINDRVQLAEAAKIIKERINRKWMLEGVTIEDPDNTYISPDATIGADTTIRPGTYIVGCTQIGYDNTIGPNTVINDSIIGDNNRIILSTIHEGRIENNVKVGPFARIRPGTVLKPGSKVGNFVEVKNSTVGEGAKASHLTYLGDSEIGEATNIGAGTITCNYDGKAKHKTKIGKEAFIGSNTVIVAPCEIGDGVLTAAGSVITKNVGDDELAIARAKQENKPGLAAKFLKK